MSSNGSVPVTESDGSIETVLGRTLCLHRQPRPGPPVLLTGGCGVSATYWTGVIQLLPDVHLTVLDRPGLGGTPWPGTIPLLAEEVATLASLVGEDEPAILVAHSMAAFHVEGFARQYPERVRGLVLVDGSVEWPTRRPRPPGARTATAIHTITSSAPMHGFGALVHRLGASFQSVESGHVLRHEQFRLAYDDQNALAMGIAEYVSYRMQAWDLMELRRRLPFPDVPVFVLTAAQSVEPHWLTRQHRLAEYLGGANLVADDCKHLMMLDQPDLIAQAVRRLL